MQVGYIFVVLITDLLTGRRGNQNIFAWLVGLHLSAQRGTLIEAWIYFVPLNARRQKRRLSIMMSLNAPTAARQFRDRSANQTETRCSDFVHISAVGCLGQRNQSRGSGGYAPSVTLRYGLNLSSLAGSMKLIALAPARIRHIVVRCAAIVIRTTSMGVEHYLTHRRLSTPGKKYSNEIRDVVLSAKAPLGYTAIILTIINSTTLMRIS